MKKKSEKTIKDQVDIFDLDIYRKTIMMEKETRT